MNKLNGGARLPNMRLLRLDLALERRVHHFHFRGQAGLVTANLRGLRLKPHRLHQLGNVRRFAQILVCSIHHRLLRSLERPIAR